jgi:hypothetical protein
MMRARARLRTQPARLGNKPDLVLCKRLAQEACRRASAAESWAVLVLGRLNRHQVAYDLAVELAELAGEGRCRVATAYFVACVRTQTWEGLMQTKRDDAMWAIIDARAATYYQLDHKFELMRNLVNPRDGMWTDSRLTDLLESIHEDVNCLAGRD